jgi:hypothetical protein
MELQQIARGRADAGVERVMAMREGETMLRVDFKKTNQELSRDITDHCLEFGIAKSTKIHRGPKQFVLVEMATHDQALNLAAYYRRSSIGSCVLLYLEQE